jgi:L-amino acid N-acyltransferase YncA
MDLIIRTVQPGDAEGIVRILNPIIAAGCYTVLDGPLTVEDERAFIAGFPPRGIFLVAQPASGGPLAGLQSLEPYAAYTHAFDHVGVIGTYVDLAHAHQGIGARLAQASFAAARTAGYEKIISYVRADNPAALAFYQHIGFRIIGTAQRQARIGGRYVDEVLIERFLPAP